MNLINPCEQTSLQTLNVVSEIEISPDPELVKTTKKLPTFTDSVSLVNGNQDGISFCGPKILELEADEYLTLDTVKNELILDSPTGANLDYKKVLTVSIELFGSKVAKHNVTVHVVPCSTFDSKPVFDKVYFEERVEVGESWVFTLPNANILKDGQISAD